MKTPNSQEAEMSVLGAMMAPYSSDIEEIIHKLTPDHFWSRANQIIFTTISEMIQKGERVDMITVSTKLRDQGILDEVGGDYYVAKLATNALTCNAMEYAGTLIEKFQLRKSIELGVEMQQRAQDCEEAKELLSDIESKLFALSVGSMTSVKGVQNAVSQLDKMVDKRRSGVMDNGLPTGIPSFDKITGGLLEGRYYVVAGRPKAGKSAFACQVALNVSMHDEPNLFISIEMSEDRLLGRMASTLSEVPYTSFLNCSASADQLNQFQNAYKVISKKPFHIETPVEPTGAEIRSLIRRYKRKHGIKLVIIDYLQKTKVVKGDVRASVSAASEAIRCAVKESEVPAIVLCQLNRDAEKESRPRMSHLKESGAIEQDADVVALLWREKEKDELEPGELVPIILTFDANRDGPECDQKLLFDGKYFKFRERTKEVRKWNE